MAKLTENEIDALKTYLDAGGKVIVTGPTPLAECENSWKLPTRVHVEPQEFFMTVPDGIHPKKADWVQNMDVAPSNDADRWSCPMSGMYYHPYRINNINKEEILKLCRKYMKSMPVKIVEAKGYLSTMYETEEQITIQFMAEDYDVDIDHELDEIRFHRSRVNLVNKIEPIGIEGILRISSNKQPEVYTPFCTGETKVEQEEAEYVLTLPENCSYVIVRIWK